MTADVPGLAEGAYRLCSINTAANHQPAIVPVAQHGSLDDCVYVSLLAFVAGSPILKQLFLSSLLVPHPLKTATTKRANRTTTTTRLVKVKPVRVRPVKVRLDKLVRVRLVKAKVVRQVKVKVARQVKVRQVKAVRTRTKTGTTRTVAALDRTVVTVVAVVSPLVPRCNLGI